MGDFTNKNNEQQQTHTAKNVEIEQIDWDLILQVWFDWSLPPWPPWQGWWPHKLQTFPGPWSSLWQQTSCQCSSCHWLPAPACQDTAPGVCAEPVQSPERHSTQRQYLQHWTYNKTAFREGSTSYIQISPAVMQNLVVPWIACSCPWRLLSETGGECTSSSQLSSPTASPDEQTYKKQIFTDDL